MKRLLLALVMVCVGLTATPQEARAVSGLYLALGAGYGHFSGDQLVVHETDGGGDQPDYGENCCPGPSLGVQLRLGFSIFGFAAPEFGFVGQGWGVGGNENGGAGFIGGGVRIFPIKFLSLFGLDSDLPIDIGIGAMFGYSLAGQDFAYTGTFWDVDFHLDFLVTSFMAIGVKLDVILPNYDAFVFTDYKNSKGRCVDGGTHDLMRLPMDKAELNCVGDGPSTTVLSPQLYLTFHFDPLSGD